MANDPHEQLIAQSTAAEVRVASDPKALLERYGQLIDNELAGLTDAFSYRLDADEGIYTMTLDGGVAVVESPLNAEFTIHRWRCGDKPLEIPLHWHRQDEWIICLEGYLHVWGKELATGQYWEADVQAHKHLHLPAFRAHAVLAEGVFLVLWTPRHPYVLAGD